ncbi:MAG: endoglucanase A [Myxococcales bacterium]|nr:endoglucanase A [Myxococcales bacterium]
MHRLGWFSLFFAVLFFVHCGGEAPSEKPASETTQQETSRDDASTAESTHQEQSIPESTVQETPAQEQAPIEKTPQPEKQPEPTPQESIPTEKTSPPEPTAEITPEPPPAEQVPERSILPPGDPGQGDIQITIHSQQERKAISPYIYGTNQPDWQGKARNLTLMRLGGNRWTAYNWENNASNAGSDYSHQNDSYLGGGDTPGEAVRMHVVKAHQAGASAIVTVPIVGYVSADKSPQGDVQNTPNYLQQRFHTSHPQKGSAFTLPPDKNDKKVYQDEFVHWLNQTFPNATQDPQRTIFYSLDNEPDLWSHTHERIHPNKVTYAEIVQKAIDYAKGIKAVAPKGLVFGPVNYGWQGYVTLQDATDAQQHGDFLEYYLKELQKADQQAGKRLLDVLDVHWYPEARGNQRITEDATDNATVDARIQAPRSLWDPTYQEQSWIIQVIQKPIRLIPRLMDKINQFYPGTKLAITEYYYGGGNHISGALAQADVLGIFGKYGVFAATLWELGQTDHRSIYAAFASYRNFDGQDGSFGDTSISAQTSKTADSSIYASVDTKDPDRMVLIAINKTNAAITASVKISHTAAFKKALVYKLEGTMAAPAAAQTINLSATNAFLLPMPARSVLTVLMQK